MIRRMDPMDLKPRPINEKIYGKEPVDQELVKSIKKIGLLEMLVIKEDGTVISGHRRLKAVLEAGHEYVKKVPCNIVGFADEFEEKEALVSYNIQRKKDDFQLSAEIEILDEIYEHRAKERQLAGLKQNKGTDDQGHTVVADSATTEQDKKNSPGRTRDKIAEDLGISSRQVGMLKKLRKASESDDQVIAQIADRLLKDPMTKNRKYNLFLNFMKIYHECNNKNPKISEYATNMVSDIYGRFTKIEDAHHELSKYIKALENKEKALKNEYPSDDYESESKEYIEDESAISEKQNKPSDILRAKPVESNKPKVSQKDPFTFAIKHRNPEVAELAAKLRLKVDNKKMSSDEAKNIIKEKIRELKRVEQAQREMMKVPEEPGEILEKESERPTHNSSKMERPKDQNNVDTPWENIPLETTLNKEKEVIEDAYGKEIPFKLYKGHDEYIRNEDGTLVIDVHGYAINKDPKLNKCKSCVEYPKYCVTGNYGPKPPEESNSIDMLLNEDWDDEDLRQNVKIIVKRSKETAKKAHVWDWNDDLLLNNILQELIS